MNLHGVGQAVDVILSYARGGKESVIERRSNPRPRIKPASARRGSLSCLSATLPTRSKRRVNRARKPRWRRLNAKVYTWRDLCFYVDSKLLEVIRHF